MESNIKQLLYYIDPATLNYQEWINVGMALKHEGYSACDWEEWSRRDSARYHPGECESKWETFREDGGSIVTGGTIYQMAYERGYQPPVREGAVALGWDDEISDDYVVVDSEHVEVLPIEQPDGRRWKPVSDLIKYLETLFNDEDIVGYVTKSWVNEDGKHVPTQGSYKKTAGQLIADLRNCKGDIGAVMGDYDPEAGAWIRFNPLDGQGCKNSNVTEYRYALVECDDMDLAKQNALIRELELPVACLVYSGGKSIHAIVKVDAADNKEYRKRVDYLYKICKKNGLIIDEQNKNPSRLSRMPGVVRGNKKQYLIDTNIGKEDWNEWIQWYKSQLDDLPECIELKDVFYNPPEMAPVQIEGILRKGHKMLIAGPSKAGKTFLEIELAVATAEGLTWCGYQCAQGRVLFINLEVDEASFIHRIKDVYEGMKVEPNHIDNIVTLNLRGVSRPLDKLAPILVNRIKKTKVDLVILDPIYKVITGDENSASDMARFCNQFDYICKETGVSMVYCHHHSKGNKSNMNAMDRASGSGVFARDPDAILDLLEVKTPLDVYINDPQTTAWKLEFTLREFAKPQPTYMYFTYPVHTIDTENTIVQENEKPEKDKKSKSEKKIEIFDDYVLSCEEPPTIAQISEEFDVTRPTVYSWIEKSKHVKKQDKKLIYELE